MRLRVPADALGERLDTFLGAQIGSRAQAQRLLERGLVRVDGRLVPKRHTVVEGETVSVEEIDDLVSTPPGGPADVELAPYAIAFEDDDLLIVEKPAGVVVHPARGHRHGTLSQALAARGAAGGEPWRAGIVHRLDKGTSGLLVVAKHAESHRLLKEMLATRLITREYLVLVDGRPPARTGTIDAPLGRDRRVRTRVSSDTDDPREARTHFELDRALSSTTLLRARLDTGRTHQIRAHFLAIGHPVCGDPEYGRAGAYGLERQFLHAARLIFEHPFTGVGLDARAPLPDDLEAALQRAAAE